MSRLLLKDHKDEKPAAGQDRWGTRRIAGLLPAKENTMVLDVLKGLTIRDYPIVKQFVNLFH